MDRLDRPSRIYFDAFAHRVLELGEDFQSMTLRSELYNDCGELGLHFADAAGEVRERLRKEDVRLSGTVPLVTFNLPLRHFSSEAEEARDTPLSGTVELVTFAPPVRDLPLFDVQPPPSPLLEDHFE
jgi:hypothetical protein